MDTPPDVLIFWAYRYSQEMGKAARAVLKGPPSGEDIEHLYKFVEGRRGQAPSRGRPGGSAGCSAQGRAA